MSKVDLIVVTASGFGVDEDDDSGMLQLHYAIRERYQGIWPKAEILYRPWNAPWSHLAKRLHKVAIPGCPTVFLGHSYGCGWGLKKFEKAWRRCGRKIDLAVLIDPVPRAFGWFLIGNLFALTRWGVVRTWARQVRLVRQLNNIPMGRPAKLMNPDDQAIERVIFGTDKKFARYVPNALIDELVHDDTIIHINIDSRPEVQDRVLAWVGKYLDALAGDR